MEFLIWNDIKLQNPHVLFMLSQFGKDLRQLLAHDVQIYVLKARDDFQKERVKTRTFKVLAIIRVLYCMQAPRLYRENFKSSLAIRIN